MPEPETILMGETLGPCPSCKALLVVSLGPDGKPDGLMHPMPMCDYFEASSPQDIVHQMATEANLTEDN